MKGIHFRYQGATLFFMAVLLVFLGLVDFIILSYQHNVSLDAARTLAQRESSLMGTFTRESLLRNDFITVRQFLTQWGEEHEDVIEIEAMAPNNFVLAHYKREMVSEDVFTVQHKVRYAGRELITLKMTKDFTAVEKSFDKLIMQMVWRSILLTVILGIALWFTLKTLALNPLEKEVARRKQAEEELTKRHYLESTINLVLKVSLEHLSLDEQLERILDLILKVPLLSLQRNGCIFLVEEKPEVLVMKAHQGYDEEVVKNCAQVPFGKCLCGKAAATSNTVFTDCLVECHKCYRGVSLHGHYCVPIVSGDRVLGVLNLVLKEGHKGDKYEEEFFSSISVTLAGIIEHKKTELEKERLQIQITESEKLSALGRMTAGVAHEIRNPLTALGGLTRRLDKIIPVGAKEKEYTKVILSETTRLERMLTSVLTFTKEPAPHRTENDINEVIDESLQLVKISFKEKSIDVRKSFADLPPILMDRDQVREVIDNLLSNAIYATPADGKITIATDKEYLDETAYVTVKITDTGGGIAEDIHSTIFEPFFTTKPVGPGHGIGLGLSISRKIMEEHGGRIRVESKIGEGATFSLFFPYL